MFAALAEPNRTELIKILLVHGPADISSIAEHLPQDRSVISRHLKVMLDADLVTCRKDGRQRIYALNGSVLIARFEAIVREAKNAVAVCCPPSPPRE